VRTALKTFGQLNTYLVVGGMAILMLLPFYWMIMTAFVPAPDIIAFPPKWIPSRLTLEHFVVALAKAPWLAYYWNSLVVAVVSVGSSLLFGLFAGYAFAVYRFPLQNFFFLMILATLMVPVQVTSVALYILLSRIGWVDTFLGILAPNFASAFGVFMIRQGIKSIPVDLIEAARMDARVRPGSCLPSSPPDQDDPGHGGHDSVPGVLERLSVAGDRHQLPRFADDPGGYRPVQGSLRQRELRTPDGRHRHLHRAHAPGLRHLPEVYDPGHRPYRAQGMSLEMPIDD
jgi:hypothetical protein